MPCLRLRRRVLRRRRMFRLLQGSAKFPRFWWVSVQHDAQLQDRCRHLNPYLVLTTTSILVPRKGTATIFKTVCVFPLLQPHASNRLSFFLRHPCRNTPSILPPTRDDGNHSGTTRPRFEKNKYDRNYNRACLRLRPSFKPRRKPASQDHQHRNIPRYHGDGETFRAIDPQGLGGIGHAVLCCCRKRAWGDAVGACGILNDGRRPLILFVT